MRCAWTVCALAIVGALAGCDDDGGGGDEAAAVRHLKDYYSAQAEFRTVDFYNLGRLTHANPDDNPSGGTGYADLYQVGHDVIPVGEPLELVTQGFADADYDGVKAALDGYYFQDISTDPFAVPYDFEYQHGLCATPAEYGVTGTDIFVIAPDGAIYRKDAKAEQPALNTGDEVTPLTQFPDVVAGGWTFVTTAPVVKSERMLNEEAAIQALLDYHAAQPQFHASDRYAIGDLVYANPDATQGIGNGYPDLYQVGYNQSPTGGVLGFISRGLAEAHSDLGPGEPAFHGFVFDDLQGVFASGSYDFRFNYGLCAAPYYYAVTGWNLFVIDDTGAIYKRHARTEIVGLTKGMRAVPLTSYPDAVSILNWVFVISG